MTFMGVDIFLNIQKHSRPVGFSDHFFSLGQLDLVKWSFFKVDGLPSEQCLGIKTLGIIYF
jgi:hypothetical protein